VKVAFMIATTHNPFDAIHWASCLRENLTSSSYGEGLETARGISRGTALVPYPTAFLQMDQTAPADQSVLRYLRERGENTNLDRRLRLCTRRYRQEASELAIWCDGRSPRQVWEHTLKRPADSAMRLGSQFRQSLFCYDGRSSEPVIQMLRSSRVEALQFDEPRPGRRRCLMA
jgi:hypothetical protein